MAECTESELAEGFIRQCGYKPKQGLRRKWYGNWNDVDRVATQTTNKGTKVTALVLKTDKKIYLAEGNDKSHQANTSIVIGDFGNGFIHTDRYTAMYRGEDNRIREQELVEGARVFTIVEKIDTGVAGELTYEILGLESGMVITELNWNSAENSGTASVVVATKEGEEESTGSKIFLMTDLAATTTWIESKQFVPEPEEP